MTHSTVRFVGIGAGVAVGAGLAGLFAWALANQSYNVWGAVVIVPVVGAVNVLIIWRVSARHPTESWLGGLLGVALLGKMVGAFARYGVAYVVYGGTADAQGYNLYAVANYRLLQQGNLNFDFGAARGTQYMDLITTVIYSVIGPSPLAAFIVFASFAFWGQYLIYRAFRLALPNGKAKRYAALVFLLPTMLYWPASIGKESWLMLFVGVTALGAAKLFAHRRGALALLALGAVGTAIIRPHIALLLFAALVVAQLFRPTGARSTDILSKIGGLVVLGIAAYILTTKSAAMLGIDDFQWQKIADSVNFREEQTVQGGSSFTPVSLTSPIGIPLAVLTVIFRPFPFEAHNLQLLVQSLEGLFLLFLTLRAWPRIKQLPRLLRRNPYISFAMVYALAFVVAFSGFGNFGILARQRVLMLPFFLILLALPSRDDEPSEPESAREFQHARY